MSSIIDFSKTIDDFGIIKLREIFIIIRNTFHYVVKCFRIQSTYFIF